MASRPVNLKKLSEHLGLSQTTVSRALNGFPEVSEKTRKRVQDLAAQLNYRPSPSAASLATGKTKTIGHVIPVGVHRMINPHFSDFLAGASEAYAAAGYELLLRTAAPGQEEEIYRDFAARRRVDGVIIHGPNNNDPRIELLQAIDLPFVVHGRSSDTTSAYSWLDVNNLSAFEKGANLLIDEGHKAIGLINGLETMNFALRRRAGYEAALEKKSIQLNTDYISSADMTEPYGYQATCEKLDLATPPTAFMYASILTALGGLRALTERGITPGKDVAIITYDDKLSFLESAMGEQDRPFFTSLQSSIQLAGKRVAEILLDHISNPEKPPSQELWEVDIVIGKTTGNDQ